MILDKSLGILFLTFVVASIAGWLVSLTGIPLGWMIGAMLAAIIATFSGLPAVDPYPLMPYVKAAVGTLLGTTVTVEIFTMIPQWWGSLLLLLVAMATSAFLCYLILYRLMKFDKGSAALCATPGGITEMIILGEQAGADQTRVAIVHALRIALCVLVIPIIISITSSIDVRQEGITNNNFMTPPDWGWFVLCIAGSIIVNRFIKLPAGLILIALLFCAGLQLTEITQFQLPAYITNLIQVLIGINVGARFIGTTLKQLAHVLSAAIVVVIIQISIAYGLAVLVASYTDLNFLALILAYSPGGLAEMSMIAVAMGIEVIFIGFHHLIRVLLALIMGPLLLSWVIQTPKLKK